MAPMATFETLLPYIDKICSENNVQMRGKIEDTLTVNGISRNLKDKIGILAGDVIKI